MKNIEHIKENYKRSTITRLMNIFNYSSEEQIDDDGDVTTVLTFLEQQKLQTQDAFFQILLVVKNN